MKIGHGLDIHRFKKNIPLIIGGIHIPYSFGLTSNTDGDIVIHSIIDSILGASSLGDIGKLFPSEIKNYKKISSRFLLRKTWNLIEKMGYSLGNIDLTIIMQDPKILPYVQDMKITISEDLNNFDINSINIKATTTEHLGFIGNNEGAACISVVLLHKKTDK